jgi:hypothetical protein
MKGLTMRTPELSPTFFVAFLIVFTLASPASSQTAVPMLLNYQGELRSPTTGQPVPDSSHDMVFRIYSVQAGGTPLWIGTHSAANANPVQVVGGVFSVILGSGTDNVLNSSLFNGPDRWLEIQVGTDTLSPRQRITSATYSLVSENARLLGGNEPSAFIIQSHGLRLEANATSPNIIAGHIGNAVAAGAVGATISGGGVEGNTNTVTVSYGTVGGGRGNQAGDAMAAAESAMYATVGGGYSNVASGESATVSGGWNSGALANCSTVGGGYANNASSDYATVGGGRHNAASGSYATISGGYNNEATADFATIAGGGPDPGHPSTTRNIVTQDYGTIGGGSNNRAEGQYASVSGGQSNTAAWTYATVGGGYGNSAMSLHSTISGGSSNIASAQSTTIGGGYRNDAGDNYATVGGGQDNTASDELATVGGGLANTAGGSCATVGGGRHNIATGAYATVGGGYHNEGSYEYATVGGGYDNNASGAYAIVGGGYSNDASSDYATLAGGRNNTVSGTYATVGGGDGNSVTNNYATVGGGYYNTVSGFEATVGGGVLNTASGIVSTVPGGYYGAATHYGEMAHASGRFAANGDAQTSVYVMRATSTGSADTDLFLDGVNRRLTVPSGRTLAFDILVVGRSTAGESLGTQIVGLIKNVGGTTTLVDKTALWLFTDHVRVDWGWGAYVRADDENDALSVFAYGEGETIRWVARVQTVEVSW